MQISMSRKRPQLARRCEAQAHRLGLREARLDGTWRPQSIHERRVGRTTGRDVDSGSVRDLRAAAGSTDHDARLTGLTPLPTTLALAIGRLWGFQVSEEEPRTIGDVDHARAKGRRAPAVSAARDSVRRCATPMRGARSCRREDIEGAYGRTQHPPPGACDALRPALMVGPLPCCAAGQRAVHRRRADAQRAVVSANVESVPRRAAQSAACAAARAMLGERVNAPCRDGPVLVTSCIGPSESRTRGVVLGAASVAIGTGVVALPFIVTCERNEGLFNNCDLARSTVVPLGALVAVFGLVRIVVQLSTPDPPPPPPATLTPVSPPAAVLRVRRARRNGIDLPGVDAPGIDR